MSSFMRLSQLSLLIQETLQDSFAYKRFWVIAEVINHSFYRQKGFHYFDLVEREGRNLKNQSKTASGNANIITKMAAVAWSTGASRIKAFENETAQIFTNDIEVLAEVSVDYHPVYGLKLTLLDIDPRFTLGQQEQQRQATIERLLNENPDYVWRNSDGKLQTFNQELEIPIVIQRIAIVSSRNAAGYEDFLHSLEDNPFHYKFTIDGFFTTVQGEQNALALAATLEEVTEAAHQKGVDYDAVVIIRGGGSGTDLLLFDRYEIAAAVAACPFPVLAGIGHQKNESITDMMAHTSLKTPTKVAEYIIQHNRTFEQELLTRQQSAIIYAQQMLAASKQELTQLRAAVLFQSQSLLFQHKQSLTLWKNMFAQRPVQLMSIKKNELVQTINTLRVYNRNLLKQHQSNIDNLIRLFRMASPENLLQRGFALIRHNNNFVSSGRDFKKGDLVDIIMADAEISTIVNSKKISDGKPFDL